MEEGGCEGPRTQVGNGQSAGGGAPRSFSQCRRRSHAQYLSRRRRRSPAQYLARRRRRSPAQHRKVQAAEPAQYRSRRRRRSPAQSIRTSAVEPRAGFAAPRGATGPEPQTQRYETAAPDAREKERDWVRQ